MVGVGFALVVAVVIGTRPTPPEPDPVPTVEPGLLTWAPRGALAGDAALFESAKQAWRAGRTIDDTRVVAPRDTVHLLWADKIGFGRVVIMQAIGTDGRPYVAQASEHGDPAVLGLDVVEALPAQPPVALTVVYDGNLNMPSLEPGLNSALIQLLTEPPEGASSAGFWGFSSTSDDPGLTLLETKPTGMTETFLQIDASAPAPIVVANSPGGRAGVLDTVTVQRGALIPVRARLALRDDPGWGPSGRIHGTEYDDLLAASGLFGESDLSGFIVASDVIDIAGVEYTADLLAVSKDDRLVGTICGVHGPEEPRYSVSAYVPVGGENAVGQQIVLAAGCSMPDAAGSLAVLARAQPGAGNVVVEQDGRVLAGPAEVVAQVVDRSVGGPVVARLEGSDAPEATYVLTGLPGD